jgi:biotin carboxylase
MIGKLITYGETRDEAIVHMNRALKEYMIRGINTNIPFLQAIISDPVFRQGQTTTRYVEEFLARTPRYLLSPNSTR